MIEENKIIVIIPTIHDIDDWEKNLESHVKAMKLMI